MTDKEINGTKQSAGDPYKYGHLTYNEVDTAVKCKKAVFQ